MSKKYPKKGLGSYLLPFILIIVLLGSGWYILTHNINIDDLVRVFQGPTVAKDERVSIAYQKGENQIKAWNDNDWRALDKEQDLQAGDTLKTSKSGTLVLRFFDGSEMRASGQSELKVIRVDKNENSGDHIAIDLVAGKLWVRNKDLVHEESDIIINTTQQIIQINKASLIDISINPELIHVIGGTATLNISQQLNGSRKPISRMTISTGQQLLLDDLIIDQLKSGDKDVLTPFNDSYLESEWYLWNLEQDKKLGLLVDIMTKVVEKKLETLDEGLVTISSPKKDEILGASILVQGTYDTEKIETIWVNGTEATVGLEDKWEATIGLSEFNNKVSVTAQEVESEEEKQVTSFTVSVDTKGPTFGEIIQPALDENDNGILTSGSIELIGEISKDATEVCVAHNDSTPSYCLKQYTAGSGEYRYLGSTGYGNVVKGKNKYVITATDELGNSSKKTVHYFKDEEKPSKRIIEEGGNASEASSSTSLLRPTITNPDPAETFETSEEKISITGNVDSKSTSLLVNGKKVDYKAGSDSFEVETDLELGENQITIQSVDKQGKKSKSALLIVLRTEETTAENESEE